MLNDENGSFYWVFKFFKWYERNILFNDALNTFYLRLDGIGHMVKDHTDSERGNTLPPLHGLHFPRQDGTYHCICYISFGALAEMKNNSVGCPFK